MVKIENVKIKELSSENNFDMILKIQIFWLKTFISKLGDWFFKEKLEFIIKINYKLGCY